jgi:NNP family nitrate/nitrite transporter-like MFS transporter
MLFGFLFKSESITYVRAFTGIGIVIMTVSVIVGVTRFQKPARATGQWELAETATAY